MIRPPMVKLGTPAGWDTLPELVAPVRLLASGRLGGSDRRAFVKRAGRSAIELAGAAARLRPGEVPVHVIAAGADHLYSCNRNGDSFQSATLADWHPTFVKSARWFRHHKHKPTDPHYGRIAASAYEPDQGLVHLLVGMYGDPAAAEARGPTGRVADLELNKLASGDPLYASMGCKVLVDVCMSCGNRARSRSEYCGPLTCPAGGCRDNLARVVKLASGDVVRVRVDNPRPEFFDCSTVDRPAAAYALGAAADWHPDHVPARPRQAVW